ncbi:uncharacterized protein PGTG_03157 [Puccinia graminis f. sp. tritici CRL 75-36-700-3]|uniref:Uncharacterized protein n=1 Tax=Puccinia graminis f. sp. tritici (strain CRL 75-36-700-3 / race SCCL) TaxID=418459 RepID=E3JYS6_PUCGT|nr:uncharacterized protein PGTG_03157 [Puccinia graminis f. sp. tritici CRL 75-36-700-3]EFP77201.2 hypothetical protein PGTG_03157 [Puccinia graminis f. sp. tritici CRL 75-36-700-3]
MSLSESKLDDLRALAMAFRGATLSILKDDESRGFASTEQVLSADDMNAHKAVLLQIETGFLPQVRQQLADLLISLNIDAGEPDSRGCSQILNNLVNNIILLSMAIQSLAPLDPLYQASRIDCSYGVLKKFRIAYLGRQHQRFKSDELIMLLRAYEKCCLEECLPRPHHKDEIVDKTEECFHIIDGMMRYSKRSDHDIIQEGWQLNLKRFDYFLQEQAERINQKDRPIQPQLLSLRQATIPIIKLVRIFYRRITSTPASKPRITFGAQMSSWQILSLHSQVNRLYKSLVYVNSLIEELEEHGQTVDGVGKLRRWINTPAEYLFSSSAFIASYYEPSASGLDSHPPENLFKTLFSDLLTQFSEASEQLQTLASKLEPSTYTTQFGTFLLP